MVDENILGQLTHNAIVQRLRDESKQAITMFVALDLTYRIGDLFPDYLDYICIDDLHFYVDQLSNFNLVRFHRSILGRRDQNFVIYGSGVSAR